MKKCTELPKLNGLKVDEAIQTKYMWQCKWQYFIMQHRLDVPTVFDLLCLDFFIVFCFCLFVCLFARTAKIFGLTHLRSCHIYRCDTAEISLICLLLLTIAQPIKQRLLYFLPMSEFRKQVPKEMFVWSIAGWKDIHCYFNMPSVLKVTHAAISIRIAWCLVSIFILLNKPK